MALLAGCGGARLPPPSTEIDETAYRDAVRTLASDDFEGRRPGTPGEEKTLAYLQAQFRRMGLKPLQGRKSDQADAFLQPVPLLEITAGADATLSLSGGGKVENLRYVKDMVIRSPGPAPDPAVSASPAVFVGYGIVAPEYHWDDYAGADVQGKTVIALVNDPGFAVHDSQRFRGGRETYYGRWDYKVAEAARRGAAAILLVHDEASAGYPWDALVNGLIGAQLRPVGGMPAPQSPFIEGWISGAAARAAFAQAGVDFATVSAAAAQPGFRALPLALTVDARLHDSFRQVASANVIGVLPGSGRKREFIVFTAHWDHLGRRGDAIFSGAVDGASGVAGLLTLAQSFVRTRPVAERSIAFMVFTGTESGLLGSAYYVANPVIPLGQIAAVVNLDEMTLGGPTRDVMIFGDGNSEVEDVFRQAALLQGRDVRPDPIPEQGMYYRGDQLTFARAGVPALLARAGLDDSARGPKFGRAQLDEYRQQRWHRPEDKYSPAWDVRGALDDLRLDYEVGNRLARSRRFPRWFPESEFSSLHAPAVPP